MMTIEFSKKRFNYTRKNKAHPDEGCALDEQPDTQGLMV